ncbi:hypothetical protein TUMEXPCC7403_07715 [Tumidithrix helvetica PCC 7403]
MTRNQERGSTGFLSWIKGIWGSFSRFIMRLLRPKRGRRSSPENSTKPFQTCSLVGVEQFHNVGSLTIGNLMAKVQWRSSKQIPKLSSSSSVKSVRNQIDWE